MVRFMRLCPTFIPFLNVPEGDTVFRWNESKETNAEKRRGEWRGADKQRHCMECCQSYGRLGLESLKR